MGESDLGWRSGWSNMASSPKWHLRWGPKDECGIDWIVNGEEKVPHRTAYAKAHRLQEKAWHVQGIHERPLCSEVRKPGKEDHELKLQEQVGAESPRVLRVTLLKDNWKKGRQGQEDPDPPPPPPPHQLLRGNYLLKDFYPTLEGALHPFPLDKTWSGGGSRRVKQIKIAHKTP